MEASYLASGADVTPIFAKVESDYGAVVRRQYSGERIPVGRAGGEREANVGAISTSRSLE